VVNVKYNIVQFVQNHYNDGFGHIYSLLMVKMEKDGYVVVHGCRKCGKCDNICPAGALYRVDGEARIDYDKCTLCGKCIEICPNKALVYLE
jgi:ferredoxin